MLDESYTLEYKMEVLEDMDEVRKSIFQGPLRQYVISTTQVRDTRVIRFHFYQDHFLLAVKRWPWLLCSDLGPDLPLGDFLGSRYDHLKEGDRPDFVRTWKGQKWATPLKSKT